MQAWASAIILLDYVAYLFLLLFFLVFFVPLYTCELLTYLHFCLWQLSKCQHMKPSSRTPSLWKHTKSIYMFLRLHYCTVSKPLAYTYCHTICPFFSLSLCVPIWDWVICLLCARCTKAILFFSAIFQNPVHWRSPPCTIPQSCQKKMDHTMSMKQEKWRSDCTMNWLAC